MSWKRVVAIIGLLSGGFAWLWFSLSDAPSRGQEEGVVPLNPASLQTQLRPVTTPPLPIMPAPANRVVEAVPVGNALRITVLIDGAPALGAKLFRRDAASCVRRDRPMIALADASGVILVARQKVEQESHVIRHEQALPYDITADVLSRVSDGEVKVQMTKGFSLTVRTRDLAGAALADVAITAGPSASRRVFDESANDQWQPGDDPRSAVWSAKTGPDGTVTIGGLPPGFLSLRYVHPSATVFDPRTALIARIPDDREKNVTLAMFYGLAVKCSGDDAVCITGMIPSTGGVQPLESSRARERAKALLTNRFPDCTVLVTAAPLDEQSGTMPREVPVNLEILGRRSGWSVVDAAMRPLSEVTETSVILKPGPNIVTAKVTFAFSNPDGSRIDYKNAVYRSPPGSRFVQGDLIIPGRPTEVVAGRYLVIMSDRAVRINAKGYEPRASGVSFDVAAGEEREVDIRLDRPVRGAAVNLKSAGGPLERASLNFSYPSASGRDVDNRFDDIEVTNRVFWLPADEDVVGDIYVPGFRKLQQRIPAGSGLAILDVDLVSDA